LLKQDQADGGLMVLAGIRLGLDTNGGWQVSKEQGNKYR